MGRNFLSDNLMGNICKVFNSNNTSQVKNSAKTSYQESTVSNANYDSLIESKKNDANITLCSDEDIKSALEEEQEKEEEIDPMDANGDGFVSRKEQIAYQSKEYDTNGDGVISDEEYTAYLEKKAETFEELNKDGHGISEIEFESANMGADGTSFTEVDKDHDGIITKEEYDTYLEKKSERFNKMDRDGDGNVSYDEYGVYEEFKFSDTNGDGVISDEEYEAYLEKKSNETTLSDKIPANIKENKLTAEEFFEKGFWETFNITPEDIQNATAEELTELYSMCMSMFTTPDTNHQRANTILAELMTNMSEEQLEEFINIRYEKGGNFESIKWGIYNDRELLNKFVKLLSAHKDLFKDGDIMYTAGGIGFYS